MFGFDAPTALLLLLGGFAAVALLSMRRLGRFDPGSDGGPEELQRRAPADIVSLLVGGLLIVAAAAASLVLLGIWP